MVDRVLLGERSGEYGLYVSSPGIDVKTAGDRDLMMSTRLQSAQVIQSGSVNLGTSSSDQVLVTIPNLGYYPLIMATSAYSLICYDFLSLTSVRFKRTGNTRAGETDFTVKYIVMNIRQAHL